MDSRKKGRESLTKVHASFVKTPVGKQDLEGPEERGWELEDGCLRPVYMTKELAPRSLVELTTCKYEKSCSRGNCNESCCNPHTAAVQLLSDSENDSDARGGGGTSLYELYRYVRSQRVWFFSRFGHK